MSIPAEAESALRYQSVTFEFDPTQVPKGSHAEYAARLLERTVACVDLDAAGLVQRYLRDVTEGLAPDRAAQLTLRTEALVATVLDVARHNVQHRLGLDLAATLLPRLERTPVQ